MRVLKLHNRQLLEGGADIGVRRETDALRRRGHVLETMLVDNRDIAEIGNARAAAKSVWNGQAAHQLTGLIHDFRPDLVHVHTAFPLMSPAVFVVAHRAGLPVITTSHSFRYSCVKATLERDGAPCEDCVGRRVKLPGVVHRCYRGSLAGSVALTTSMALHRAGGTFTRCIDRYLAFTPFMRDRIIAEGIAPDRVVVKTNGAPDPGPPRAERGGYALYAGRLVPEKGIATLLAGWASYAGPLELVVAGEGALASQVDAAAARDPRITRLGWQDEAHLLSLLAGAEALVLPSEWYEGLPRIQMEAFAAGTPVISSDIGNFTDFVEPGVNGTRFTTADPDSLRAALDWFDSEADRAALRAGARDIFERRFDEEVVLDHLEAIYREVLAERGRPAT